MLYNNPRVPKDSGSILLTIVPRFTSVQLEERKEVIVWTINPVDLFDDLVETHKIRCVFLDIFPIVIRTIPTHVHHTSVSI